MRRLLLLMLLGATVLVGMAWPSISRMAATGDLEHEAFRVVDGETPTTAGLIHFYDQYPRADAGVRLVTQAAICLSLSTQVDEFRRLRPKQFDEALKIALSADEYAFGSAAELRLKTAKRFLRAIASAPGYQ